MLVLSKSPRLCDCKFLRIPTFVRIRSGGQLVACRSCEATRRSTPTHPPTRLPHRTVGSRRSRTLLYRIDGGADLISRAA